MSVLLNDFSEFGVSWTPLERPSSTADNVFVRGCDREYGHVGFLHVFKVAGELKLCDIVSMGVIFTEELTGSSLDIAWYTFYVIFER
jgi:hypothetical protein